MEQQLTSAPKSRNIMVQFFIFFGLQTLIIVLGLASITFSVSFMDSLYDMSLSYSMGDFSMTLLFSSILVILMMLWFLIDYKLLKKFAFPATKVKPFLYLFSWFVSILSQVLILSTAYAWGLIDDFFFYYDDLTFPFFFIFILSYIVFSIVMFLLFKFVVYEDTFSIRLQVNTQNSPSNTQE